MRLLRASLGVFRYVRNTQVLKETGIPSIPEAALKYAANLRRSVSSHANPSIRVLANYRSKSYDWVRRPCLLIPPSG